MEGTDICEGEHYGRKVVVKCMPKAVYSADSQEVGNLIKANDHQNIVRYFGVENDEHLVYLVIEHCICSLNDLISLQTGPHNSGATGAPRKTDMQDIKLKLWEGNDHPSALLIKLMRDMVDGLGYLHEKDIFHRGIKPQNVVIAKGKDVCAKLSDIGIYNYKCLPSDMSSSSQNDNGSSSSSGFEQMHWKDQMRAEDMFSLGRVFLFCLSRGVHPDPFDKMLECDSATCRILAQKLLISFLV